MSFQDACLASLCLQTATSKLIDEKALSLKAAIKLLSPFNITPSLPSFE
ncbi:hypothetical protein PZB74_14360 [Porifericola rhodea]|nr:hypothetical protein [Porifericola rhodea]WKN30145.1 hypothetical protein PZB74_14360 [Porifericola rhodea]